MEADKFTNINKKCFTDRRAVDRLNRFAQILQRVK
jgi:hypothetical protein